MGVFPVLCKIGVTTEVIPKDLGYPEHSQAKSEFNYGLGKKDFPWQIFSKQNCIFSLTVAFFVNYWIIVRDRKSVV